MTSRRDVLISPGAEFFAANRKYLFLVGLWPKENFDQFKKRLYFLAAITIHCLGFSFLVITTIGSYEQRHDSQMLMTNLDKSLVGYGYILKIFSFELAKKDYKLLISDIMISGDRITEQCRNRMTLLIFVISFLVVSVVTAFSLIALYEGEMTVEAWMPFDPQASLTNQLTAVQVVAVTFIVPCALRGIAIQTLICSIIMYFCEQLDDVQKKLRGLCYDHHERDFRKQFNDILKKHIRLIGYSKAMNRAFRYFFFVNNFGMTIEMCLNALVLTMIGTQEKKTLATFLVYLFTALFNTFVYCYLGTQVLIKSQGVALAAYDTPWPHWPAHVQKDIFKVIVAAQRPIKIRAAVDDMSLETYSQLVANGYRLFTVLHDMI